MLRSLLNSRTVLRIAEVLDRRQENRTSEFGMLAQAFDFVKTNGIPGDYFEVGLWRGKTFTWARLMAKRYGVSGVKVRGFDSFRGLPAPAEPRYNIWQRGGRPDMGAQRALSEFQSANPAFRLRPYIPFGGLGMSFLHHFVRADD